MDFKAARLLTTSAALLLSASAHGAAVSNWIWDDNGTLSAAANCQSASASDTHFRVLPSATGSIQGASIVVAGDNHAAKLLTPLDIKSLAFTTAVGLKDIADCVLQLTSSLIPSLTIDAKKISLANSFWQVGVDDSDAYVIMTCGTGKTKKDYVAFDVFVAGSATPIARIGVNPSNAEILRNAIVLNPEQAEKIAAAADGKAAVSNPNRSTIQSKKPSMVSRTSSPSTAPAKPASTPASKPSSASKGSGSVSGTEPVSAKKAASARPTAPDSLTPDSTTPALDDPTGAAPSPTPGREVPVVNGGLQFVLCSTQPSIAVRNDKLDRTLFNAKALEEVKLMQSFSPESPTKKVSSDHHIFIEVQFANRETGSNIGWIDQQEVRARSACRLKDPTPVAIKRPTRTAPGSSSGSSGFIRDGLNDASCCEFPMRGRPTMSYLQGARRFRAMRAAGRLHAACDLYRPAGESIVSISDGKVLRTKYYFYEGVFALEILQDGGYVARYGEILGKNPTGVSPGNRVVMGQTVGYVGTVDSGCCKPMLHFELYRGNANGPLTERSSSGFQRRSDLTNPTPFLQEWEKKKFGESY